MLDVLMGWKQQISCEQLAYDAPDRPDVALLIPCAALHNNFRGSILPGIYYGTMIIVVLGCSAEIDYSYFFTQRKIVLVWEVHFFGITFA